MKAKNLFLTLTLLLLLPLAVGAATATDAFDFSLYGGENGELSFGGLPCSSGAVYGGSISFAKKPTKHATMSTSQFVCTKTSPGTANRVSITWRGSGNTSDESILKVYGKHSAFAGGETPSDLGTTPGVTLIGSHVYSSGSYTANIDVAAGYEYIAIATGDAKIDFTYIAITWTVPDVVNYSINITQTGSGYVWAEKPGDDDITEAAAGEEVTIYFYGIDDGTELRSFSVYGESAIIDKTLSEDEYTGDYSYTFTMPEHSVDVNAVLAAAPSPARSANPISVNGVANTYDAILQSGIESTFTISTAYNAGTSPAYNKTLKSVTSANGRVEIVSNTYSSATGTGTLTLRGLATGADVVTITTYQTNGTIRSSRNINVTVVARDVALVTELNGKYYAVTNSPSGTTVAAVELFEDGGYYYYKSAGDLSNISWKAENTADGYYIRNSADQYLKVAGTTMSLSGSAYEWYKNAGDAFVTGYTTGMCYDESYSAFVITGQYDHSSVSTISACVHEIPVASLALATEYTRSLTNGNYATMCLPFAVSASETFFSGAEVYIIVGKHVSAGNVTGIELEQVTGNLVAGKPYVILATASTLSAWHGADLVGSPVNGDGLVGNLNSTPLIMPDGTYGISGNKLRKINGGTGKVNQYRAYIDLDGIPEVAATPTPAPGRRVIVTENSTESEEQQDVETSLEDLLNHATSIDWNQPVYNALGQRVGKGTTGVLIQNGQKFFVQ